MTQKIGMIVITNLYGLIGYEGKIPFNYKEDRKRFKEITMGGVLIMGRKTYESLPDHKLPGRDKYVLSRQHLLKKNTNDTKWFDSLKKALLDAPEDKQIWIAGGGELYNECLNFRIPDFIDMTISLQFHVSPVKHSLKESIQNRVKIKKIPLHYSMTEEWLNINNDKLLHRRYTLNKHAEPISFLEELKSSR
jgi:dihydrofolate reductase